MATLTIEDVPDWLLEQLREEAAREKQTLSGRALARLMEAMPESRDEARWVPSAQEVERQVQQWRRLAGRWKSDRPAEEEIAAIYAARSAGREVSL